MYLIPLHSTDTGEANTIWQWHLYTLLSLLSIDDVRSFNFSKTGKTKCSIQDFMETLMFCLTSNYVSMFLYNMLYCYHTFCIGQNTPGPHHILLYCPVYLLFVQVICYLGNTQWNGWFLEWLLRCKILDNRNKSWGKPPLCLFVTVCYYWT